MPRDLGITDTNKLTIEDGMSGGSIELSYRTPTTKERVGYQAESFRREGNKIRSNLSQTRLKYGLEILTGIRDGDFTLNGEPLSSDKESPGYRTAWKEIVAAAAADIVMALAMTVFEGTKVKGAAVEGVEFEPEEIAEDVLPFQKS